MKGNVRFVDHRPLAGKRVVFFRDETASEVSEGLVRSRGGLPVSLPVLVLRSLADDAGASQALADLRSYGWVFFTSRAGVTMTSDALFRKGCDTRAFGGAKIAAIGSSTARALRDVGLAADFVPRIHEGSAMAEEWSKRVGTPQRILLLRARVASVEILNTLSGAGHSVDDVAIYETSVADDLDPAPLASADVLLFTSPSTVRGYLALAKKVVPALLARRASPMVASIGAVTSRALEEASVRVDVEAKTSTFADLLEAVEAAFASHRN